MARQVADDCRACLFCERFSGQGVHALGNPDFVGHEIVESDVDRTVRSDDVAIADLHPLPRRTGFEVIAPAMIVADDREDARTAGIGFVRQQIAFYGSTPAYRPVLEVEGWEDLQGQLTTLTKTGRWEEMAGVIDDTVLSTIAAVGTPEEVAAEVADRFAGLVDRIGFYTPGPMADDTVGELVDAWRGRPTEVAS